MITYPARFSVNDVVIDTTTRKTLKVVRLVGSTQVEVQDIAFTDSYQSEVIDTSYLIRGTASGSIKRIT